MEEPEDRGSSSSPPPIEIDGMSWQIESRPRPWLPAALAVFAALALLLWLVGSSTEDVDSAATTGALLPPAVEETTPPAAIVTPVTLGEMLPWLDGRGLILFAADADSEYVLTWGASSSEPSRFRLSGSNIATIRPEPANLDFVAYETLGRTTYLYVGDLRMQEPIFVGSRGFAWDPKGSGTLMWIGEDQSTLETALYRTTVFGWRFSDETPSALIQKVADLPSGTRLAGWTEQGLVMAVDLGGPVNVLDAESGDVRLESPTMMELRDLDGTLIATVVAEPWKATSNGTIVARGTSDAFAIAGIEPHPTALVVPDGFVVLDASADSGGFTLRGLPHCDFGDQTGPIVNGTTQWDLSEDGRWVGSNGVLCNIVDQTLREFEQNDGVADILGYGGIQRVVGFSQDSQWFFTHAAQDGKLFMASVDGGQRLVVPVDDWVRFRGAFIHP